MFILLSIILCIVLFVVTYKDGIKFSNFANSFIASIFIMIVAGFVLFLLNISMFKVGVIYEHVSFIKAKNELYPNLEYKAEVNVIKNNNYENGFYLQTIKLKDNTFNKLYFLWNIPKDVKVEQNKLYLIKNDKE